MTVSLRQREHTRVKVVPRHARKVVCVTRTLNGCVFDVRLASQATVPISIIRLEAVSRIGTGRMMHLDVEVVRVLAYSFRRVPDDDSDRHRLVRLDDRPRPRACLAWRADEHFVAICRDGRSELVTDAGGCFKNAVRSPRTCIPRKLVHVRSSSPVRLPRRPDDCNEVVGVLRICGERDGRAESPIGRDLIAVQSVWLFSVTFIALPGAGIHRALASVREHLTLKPREREVTVHGESAVASTNVDLARRVTGWGVAEEIIKPQGVSLVTDDKPRPKMPFRHG